jgi:hypothetical protein
LTDDGMLAIDWPDRSRKSGGTEVGEYGSANRPRLITRPHDSDRGRGKNSVKTFFVHKITFRDCRSDPLTPQEIPVAAAADCNRSQPFLALLQKNRKQSETVCGK